MEFEGLDKLVGKLERADSILLFDLNDAVRKAGLLMENASKRIMPVDTGRMRQSTHTELAFLAATVIPEVNYALFVHEGTSRQSPQPFFKQALKENGQRAEQIMKKALDKAIDKFAKL